MILHAYSVLFRDLSLNSAYWIWSIVLMWLSVTQSVFRLKTALSQCSLQILLQTKQMIFYVLVA
jgi:hypothetical protein